MAEDLTKKSDIIELKGTPGTEFVTDYSSIWGTKSTGVISGIAKGAAKNRYHLHGAYYSDMFPLSWHGVPRESITAKAMWNGDVYLWAKYKFPGGRAKTVSNPLRFSMTSSTEQVKVLNDENDKDIPPKGDGGVKRYAGGTERTVVAMIIDIKWNFDKELYTKGGSIPANAMEGLLLTGSLNSGELMLHSGLGSDYMPAGSCLFLGTEMVKQNNLWTYHHKARYREVPVAKKPGREVADIIHWEQPYLVGKEVKYADPPYPMKPWTAAQPTEEELAAEDS